MGANDGIVSTSSLIIGIAAANSSQENILLAGIAGLVAGAVSMAAGEYVSVSSQSDTEVADLELEKKSLESNLNYEKRELAELYHERGLDRNLATEVAEQLMAHDALGAHARDELGIMEINKARPITAAVSSAATFSLGSALPLLCAWVVPVDRIIVATTSVSLSLLAMLGALAAIVGGAPIIRASLRVLFWGAFAMALTAVVGWLFDHIV